MKGVVGYMFGNPDFNVKMKFINIYITLLSLQVPFNVFYIFLLTSDMAEKYGTVMLPLYAVIAFFYFSLVIAMAVINIIRSFSAFNKGDYEHCIRGMVRLKYGMIPFYIVNFFSILFILALIILASRGIIVVAGFIVIPVVFIILGAIFFITWLSMLPGAFFGVQALRSAVRSGSMTSLSAFFHGILQFIFCIDVFDTAYLTAVKWKRNRVSAIIVCTISLMAFVVFASVTVWCIGVIF